MRHLQKLEQRLYDHFGFSTFRKGQKETIASLLNGNDTLTQLPTGTGKSVCYQLTGLLLEGIVIIVTPLISLMEDQVQKLRQQKIANVTYLNSQLTKEERYYILTHLAEYKFLFLSPEMLHQARLLQALKQLPIALFVVDEAHCISQWGMDFRPEYRQLQSIKATLGHPLTLALTASATPEVRNEIIELLFPEKYQTIVYSVDRPNIQLFVRQTEDKLTTLKEVLALGEGATIIYCATRKKVEEVYQYLNEYYAVGYYHGGLTANERSSLQQQFQTNQLQILIATNAFGMGIDKSDIRFVIHYDLPDSIENYIQEIGRAGRDGQESYAMLLYQSFDEKIHHFFQEKLHEEIDQLQWLLKQKEPERLLPKQETLQTKWLREAKKNPEFVPMLIKYQEVKQQKLLNMQAYIKEDECYRHVLLAYFGEDGSNVHPCCALDGATWPTTPRALFEKTAQLPWMSRLAEIFKED